MKKVQTTEKQKQIAESSQVFKHVPIEKWNYVIFVVNEKTLESNIAFVSSSLASAEVLFEHAQEEVTKTKKWLGEDFDYAFLAKTVTKPTTSFSKAVYDDSKKGVFKPLTISRLPNGSLVEVEEEDYEAFMAEPSTKEALAKGVVIKKIKSR